MRLYFFLYFCVSLKKTKHPMIQRIQSLYISIAIALMAFVASSPLLNIFLNSGEYTLTSQTIANNQETLTTITPLFILVLASILLDAIALISFKKRYFQIRALVFSIVLKVGFYGLIALYIFQLKEDTGLLITYKAPITFPIISSIISYLGIRAIIKDEALVKSLDRIR